MPGEDEHRYTFGAPSQGWPAFDEDGKVVRPEPDDPNRTENGTDVTR